LWEENVSQPTWEQIEAVIAAERGRTGVHIGVTVDEDVITVAEQVVGPFPATYRRFVAKFGWIETPTYVINGLGAGVPVSLDVVAETLAERTELEPGLPAGYIVVSADGNGNVYCVESADAASSTEPPVMFRDHEFGRGEMKLEEYAESFAAMLYERAKWWNT